MVAQIKDLMGAQYSEVKYLNVLLECKNLIKKINFKTPFIKVWGAPPSPTILSIAPMKKQAK